MTYKYTLDANILINFHRSYYPFDIAPSFWRQLAEKSKQKVVLLDKIKVEIAKNDDKLAQWLAENDHCFLTKSINDTEIVSNYSKIITSVKSNRQYTESAKIEFANIADSWLCALAITYNYVIVTQETYQPEIKRRVKIPNICKEFNIHYIDMLRFIRDIGIRFD
ncbi:MAG: DUF4411 family protein [Bacillota bacterium]|jgi:hypothetical protein